eukprot:612281-Amphidinium_carterae.2
MMNPSGKKINSVSTPWGALKTFLGANGIEKQQVKPCAAHASSHWPYRLVCDMAANKNSAMIKGVVAEPFPPP